MKADPNENNKSFIAKIDTPFKALEIVRVVSKLLVFFGVLQMLGGIFLGTILGVIDAAINIVGAFFIYKFHSRVASVFILATALLVLLGTFASYFEASGVGLFVVLVEVWAGARVTEATYKLHGKFKT